MHLQLGELPFLVVSSPDMTKEFINLSIAQRPKLLASNIANYGGADIAVAFSPYGQYWTQMRNVCILELLSNKRVQSFSFIRVEEVGNLVQSIPCQSSTVPPLPIINLTERLYQLMSTITCRAAFGNKCSEQDVLVLISALREGTLLAGVSIWPICTLRRHFYTG